MVGDEVSFENKTNVVVVVVVVVLESKVDREMKQLIDEDDLPSCCGGRCCTERRGEMKRMIENRRGLPVPCRRGG